MERRPSIQSVQKASQEGERMSKKLNLGRERPKEGKDQRKKTLTIGFIDLVEDCCESGCVPLPLHRPQAMDSDVIIGFSYPSQTIGQETLLNIVLNERLRIETVLIEIVSTAEQSVEETVRGGKRQEETKHGMNMK